MGKCADNISNAFKEVEYNMVMGMSQVNIDKILPPDFRKRILKVTDYLLTPEERFQKYLDEDKYNWKKKYYPDSRTDIEGMTNMPETQYNNIPVIKSIRDAVYSRHHTFNESPTFKQDCEANAEKTVNEIITEEKADLQQLEGYMKSFLQTYKSIFNYKSSIGPLVNAKKNELDRINTKIDTYKQNLFIDSRKDNYQNKNLEFYKTIFFYILIVYYSLFVLYLIFSDFFKEEKYKDKFFMFLIVSYLIIPLIAKYIIVYIHKAYIYMLEYNNIREDIISYPYIIEEKQKYE